MNDQKPTLRRIMAKAGPELGRSNRATGLELKDRIARDFKDSKWPAQTPDVASTAAELLNVPLPDLLVAGWGKTREILTALKESKDSPGESTDVWLAEHTFEGTLHPYLEIRVGGIPQPKPIEFTIDLSCTLKGIVLRIQDGRVVKILEGTGEFKGALKYQELTLFESSEESSKPIDLGSSIDLAPAAAPPPPPSPR